MRTLTVTGCLFQVPRKKRPEVVALIRMPSWISSNLMGGRLLPPSLMLRRLLLSLCQVSSISGSLASDCTQPACQSLLHCLDTQLNVVGMKSNLLLLPSLMLRRLLPSLYQVLSISSSLASVCTQPASQSLLHCLDAYLHLLELD